MQKKLFLKKERLKFIWIEYFTIKAFKFIHKKFLIKCFFLWFWSEFAVVVLRFHGRGSQLCFTNFATLSMLETARFKSFSEFFCCDVIGNCSPISPFSSVSSFITWVTLPFSKCGPLKSALRHGGKWSHWSWVLSPQFLRLICSSLLARTRWAGAKQKGDEQIWITRLSLSDEASSSHPRNKMKIMSLSDTRLRRPRIWQSTSTIPCLNFRVVMICEFSVDRSKNLWPSKTIKFLATSIAKSEGLNSKAMFFEVDFRHSSISFSSWTIGICGLGWYPMKNSRKLRSKILRTKSYEKRVVPYGEKVKACFPFIEKLRCKNFEGTGFYIDRKLKGLKF